MFFYILQSKQPYNCYSLPHPPPSVHRSIQQAASSLADTFVYEAVEELCCRGYKVALDAVAIVHEGCRDGGKSILFRECQKGHESQNSNRDEGMGRHAVLVLRRRERARDFVWGANVVQSKCSHCDIFERKSCCSTHISYWYDMVGMQSLRHLAGRPTDRLPYTHYFYNGCLEEESWICFSYTINQSISSSAKCSTNTAPLSPAKARITRLCK